jgi:type IX secretion system PorP/SprF family membrane protein
MKKYIIFIILIISVLKVYAQQEPQYTHYSYNRLAYNPAVAGSMGNGVLGLLYRNQWSGIDGAPQTGILTGHMPIMKNRGGIGLTLTADQLGMTNSNFAVLSYAYRIPINANATLSLGLQGEVEETSLDWSKALLTQKNDQLANTTTTSRLGGNAGAGIYFKTSKYFIGLSVPRLLKNRLYQSIPNQKKSSRDFRSYFAQAGATFPITKTVDFIPMTMISFGPSIPTIFDLGANVLFMKRFGAGLNWRYADSMDGLLQFQVNNRLKAGFAYDFTTSPLKKTTKGSWEIMFEYQFKCNANELVNSIRYF